MRGGTKQTGKATRVIAVKQVHSLVLCDFISAVSVLGSPVRNR